MGHYDSKIYNSRINAEVNNTKVDLSMSRSDARKYWYIFNSQTYCLYD